MHHKYYVLDQSFFSVVDEQNGSLLIRLVLAADQFWVPDEARGDLVFLCRAQEKLAYYSLDGEFRYDLDVADFLCEDLQVLYRAGSRQELGFIDKISLDFYWWTQKFKMTNL